jgi:hypothetical protein
MNTYNLTLCDLDGTLMAVVPEAPALPRFLHITGQSVALSDDAEPPADETDHVTTFARIASAVWVDDDRNALFVRVAS